MVSDMACGAPLFTGESMPEPAEDITRNTLKRLAALVGQEEREVRDSRCSGLSIRLRKTGAAWTLRGRLVGKQSTWRVGSIAALQDPKAARERAGEAKRLLTRGIDPSDWLKEREAGGPIVRTGDPKKDGWLWEEAVAAFLLAKAKNSNPHTITCYRNALRCPGLRGVFDGRPMRSITTKDLREAVEAIDKSGKTAQANLVLRVAKSLFSWCTQQSMSGIADTPSAASIVKPREHEQRRGYVPTRDELAALFWRMDAAPAWPQARLAAALLVLTAQRRETVITARVDDLKPWDEREGWGMWRMEADPQLQIDRHHAIPLPPLAWAVVGCARQLAGASPWLFPQMRLRRAADAGTAHMSGNVVADVLRAASGGTTSPHDLRRALATHGPDVLAMKDENTRKVLNHASGGNVTTRHYAFHESIPDKTAVLGAWEDWLVGLMLGAAPTAGAWPSFLPVVGARG